jgi:hypothetical protein
VLKSVLIACIAIVLSSQAALAANIRASHLAPRAPTVDVYLNGVKTFANLPFRTVTSYLQIPDGTYDVTVYAAGQTSNPILEAKNVDLENGSYTITAAGFGPTKSVNPVVLQDDLAPIPNRPKLRLVNAALEYNQLSLNTVSGIPLLSNVPFKSASPYLSVLPLLQDFNICSGTTKVLGLRELNLLPGRVYTLFVVGSKSENTLNYVLTEDKL